MKKGFVTLMTVLLLSVLTTSVTVSLLLLQIQSSRQVLTSKQGSYARSYASNCAEQALQELATNPNYSGSQTLTYATGNCSWTVTQGTTKHISIFGTSGNVQKELHATVNDTGVTWSEIP